MGNCGSGDKEDKTKEISEGKYDKEFDKLLKVIKEFINPLFIPGVLIAMSKFSCFSKRAITLFSVCHIKGNSLYSKSREKL